jgi:NADP-dependent 3-hydroxy acid dehydrogenase YdfG
MSDPLKMFDVKGNVALITGASGAFGMVAARVLAGAGAKLVLVAGSKDALNDIAIECREMGAEVFTINARPSDEATCEAMMATAQAEMGSLDILVVASGMNKVCWGILRVTPLIAPQRRRWMG